MKKIFLSGLLLVGFLISVNAQDQLSYGFKAGLNFNKITGDKLTEESYDVNLGFHIGIIFKYEITDLYGLKWELMYSQKGVKYAYKGPSSFLLQETTTPLLLSGERDMNVDISNDYLDIPVMGYGKFGPVELSAGFNVGLLVGSFGGGQIRFNGTSPANTSFELNLDHRYFGDKVGEATTSELESIDISGQRIDIPKQLGAYYEYQEKDGSKYNFIDIGVNAGIALFINEGLNIGFRANYGLIDVSRSPMDISYKDFDGNYPAIVNDKNRQVSYQVSLGFSF
jgi:hypothetical protein